MPQRFECLVGDMPLIIETGKLANQADGSVTLSYGDTLILATACASSGPREGATFLPLTVDYEEKHYAAGKIPGSFIRRESRPSQDAILADRITDRSIRPLFPKDFRNEIQVVLTVLSTDQENTPDVLTVIGASAALSISSIPFDGPAAAVRVGCIDGSLVLNPTFTQLMESSLDIVVSSAGDALAMVEAGAREVDEKLVMEAIEFGHRANLEIVKLQRQLMETHAKPKMEFTPPEPDPAAEEAVASILGDRLNDIVPKDKVERGVALGALKEELRQKLEERFSANDIGSALENLFKKEVRRQILEHGKRVGGRGLTEIRPITCEVGLLPRTHGSGLFTRGGTQILTTTTLGSTRKEQLIDTISQEESKRFLHHYNFPPFSVGEVRRMVGPGRREIGHGALAAKALVPILPSEEDFPYTLRLVSEALSSNGSTSMASVCASSLSMMDAGIPVKAPVAGVAMGVVAENDKYVLLTDIEGAEDAYGNMDFKVAGTAEGVTALQMDIKLKGIPFEVISQALAQARDARLFILDKMNQTLGVTRPELNKYAPRMYKISIDPEKIGTVIGPGGRTIRGITEETKATVDVENDGTVLIGSNNEESAQKAIKIIEALTKEVAVGEVYTGKVTRLMNFGAFVEILPGKEGMVHISELADYRVPSVEEAVKVGDEVMVKVIEIDRMGRVNLSRRAVYQEGAEGAEAGAGSTPKPHSNPPPRGDRPYGGPPRRPQDRDRRPPRR